MTETNRAMPHELVRSANVGAASFIQEGDINEALNILERTVNVLRVASLIRKAGWLLSNLRKRWLRLLRQKFRGS